MHRRIYNLDRLIEYGTEAIPDTTRVINPAWRHLDSQIRRQNGLLSRELLQFAEIQLPQEMEPREVEAYERKKGKLQQAIEERRQQIEQLKAQRKALAKHIEIKDLPDKDPFQRPAFREKVSVALFVLSRPAFNDRLPHFFRYEQLVVASPLKAIDQYDAVARIAVAQSRRAGRFALGS